MRFRLFPVLIAAAVAAFAVKAGGLWQSLGPLSQVKPAVAEDLLAPAAGPPEDRDAGSDVGGPARDAAAAAPPAVAGLPGDPLEWSDEEIDLLQMLAERRAEIDRRAAELEQSSVLLEAAERRIDEKISELESLQKTIEALLARRDEEAEAQIASLVKIYESMKPKEAARIFEQLDMVVLLEVVDRMKERKTAPILAKMNPRRAKEITLELAKRRERPVAKK